MKEKVNQLLQEAINLLGENSDITIIVHKDDQCGAVVHGSIDVNAQALFACIHQSENALGQALYRILKLNMLNIINNPSPFAQDLADSFIDFIDKLEESPKEKEEGEIPS